MKSIFLFLYLFSSTVFAISFSPVEIPGATSSALIPAQTDQSAIYAKTHLNIFQSVDSGVSWAEFSDFPDPRLVEHLAFINNQLIVTTSRAVYRRNSAGDWDMIFELSNGENQLKYTFINPDQSNHLILISKDDSQVTETSGANWETLLSYHDLQDVVLSEDGRKLYFVASLYDIPSYEPILKIYNLQNQSWITKDLPNDCLYHTLKTTPAYPERIYLLSSQFCEAELGYSDDDEEWDSILFPVYGGFLEYTWLTDFEISEQNPDFFVLSTISAVDFAPIPTYRNYISYDGGESWNIQLHSSFSDATLVGSNLLINNYTSRQILIARNFFGSTLSIPTLNIKGLILMIGLTIFILMRHLNKKKS